MSRAKIAIARTTAKFACDSDNELIVTASKMIVVKGTTTTEKKKKTDE